MSFQSSQKSWKGTHKWGVGENDFVMLTDCDNCNINDLLLGMFAC